MEEREDLLSILREHRPYYFWVLVAQMIISGAAIAWWEVVYGGHASAIGAAIAVALKMSALIPLWALTTVIIVDSGRRIMVLLPDGRAKIRAEARAEGEAEGRAEGIEEGMAEGIVIGEARGEARGKAQTHSDWAVWYARWKECNDKGEPFDEPPPAPPDGYRNGASGGGGSE